MIAKSGTAMGLGAFALLALLALGASPRGAAAADSAPLNRTLPPSNSALLQSALRGASTKLAQRAPITPGSRIVVEIDGEGPLALDARQAMLEAFTGRRIEVVLGSVGGGEPGRTTAPAPVDTAQAQAMSNVITAPPPTGEFAGGSLSNTFGELQRERLLQQQRADSIARAAAQGGSAAPGSSSAPPSPSRPSTVLAANGDLPRVAVRVEEARVDYVRQYRGGILGAYRVERRATARLGVRLASAGGEFVTWTASADSSLGDVVLRSDLPSLETKTRPETVGQLPQAGFKKFLEPVLVIVLVAGLVSLFYQNRP